MPYESTYQKLERERRVRRHRLALALEVTTAVGGMIFLYLLFRLITTWGL